MRQVIEWRDIDDKLMSREEYYFRSKQDEWEVYAKVVSGVYRSYDGKWVDITLDNCIVTLPLYAFTHYAEVEE